MIIRERKKSHSKIMTTKTSKKFAEGLSKIHFCPNNIFEKAFFMFMELVF